MDRKRHLAVDRAVFGQEFNQVHKWLDALFPKYVKTNPFLHWKERHHLKAVAKKYDEFSIESAVAQLHILCDLLSHFRLPLFHIPEDEHEVLEMLQDLGLHKP